MLLYRISPIFPMQWVDTPLTDQVKDLDAHLCEIADNNWKAANSEPDETTIRLALRYGAAQESFLVFSGETVIHHRHSVDLADTERRLAAMLPNLGADLTASIAYDSARDVATSRARVAEAIAGQDPDPILVLHWEDLGGYLPTPI